MIRRRALRTAAAAVAATATAAALVLSALVENCAGAGPGRPVREVDACLDSLDALCHP